MGSLPGFLPGYQALDDTQTRKRYEERWGQSLPTNAGLTALEIIEQAERGKIRGMLIVGENPVTSFPGTSLVRKALASLEFMAVIDLFLTETAELATVVLPAASFAEKEGTFTNFEGRVQRVRKAIEPLGESLPDWQIILKLAEAIGSPMPYSSPHQIMDEIEELVPLYQRQADNDLGIEDLDWVNLEVERSRTRRLYQGPFPSGFGRFATVEYIPPQNLSRDGYPLTLISGSVLHQFGSGTRSHKASRLKKFSSKSWVEIGIADAQNLGLSDGDAVRIASPVGEVVSSIRITDTLPAGTLFMPISFPECSVNELLGIDLDPRSKTPSSKACAVKLERISENG